MDTQNQTSKNYVLTVALFFAIGLHLILLSLLSLDFFQMKVSEPAPLEVELQDWNPSTTPIVKHSNPLHPPSPPIQEQSKIPPPPDPAAPELPPQQILNDLVQEVPAELRMRNTPTSQKQTPAEIPPPVPRAESKPVEPQVSKAIDSPTVPLSEPTPPADPPRQLSPPGNPTKSIADTPEPSVIKESQSKEGETKTTVHPPEAKNPLKSQANPPLPNNYLLSSQTGTAGKPSPPAQSGAAQPSPAKGRATVPNIPRVSQSQKQQKGMFYELSDYNWPYEPYMARWARMLSYTWNNNPPNDYLRGEVPRGGEVTVLVSVNRAGRLQSYEVTGVHQSSDEMVASVVSAILGTSNLPQIPPDFQGDVLMVHFRFIYPAVR